MWNFGDKGPYSELNLTGINLAKRVSYTFKKHGHFVVTLRATNAAGHFEVSTEVTVLGRLLSPEACVSQSPQNISVPKN